MVEIKRERWKGRYVVTARDKGKIITWKKWDRQPVRNYRDVFKVTGTFEPDVERVELRNVVEWTSYKEGARPRRATRYQYVITAYLRNGEKISARSQAHEPSYPINDARQETLTSFYERVAESQGKGYDEDEGRKVSNKAVTMIKEGVVWYAAKHPK